MNYKFLGISSVCSIAIGIAMATLIINSENGYIGSMIFLPVFVFVILVSFILFISSIIGFTISKNWGVNLLISAFLFPASFLTACLIAKYFEIGAYHQEPMIQLKIFAGTLF